MGMKGRARLGNRESTAGIEEDLMGIIRETGEKGRIKGKEEIDS